MDVGVELPLRVWTDSSAAIGICSRQGLGKLRHLDTHTLWIQQAVRTKRVDLRKVDGECNPADILTKHSISRQRLESLIALYGCKYLGGRAESAPQLREGESSKKTMATAGGEISGIEDPRPAEEHGSGPPPIMPHLTYPSLELDRLYPSIETPDDDQLDDLVDDSADFVYQKGLKITAEIRAETTSQGRRRRPTLASLRRDIGDALSISRRRSIANPASATTTGLATTTTAWTTASSSTTTCATTTTTPATSRKPCPTARFRRRIPSTSRPATSTEQGRHLSSLLWRTRPFEGRHFAGGVLRLGAPSASLSAFVALAQDTLVSSLTAPDNPTQC